MKKIIAIFSLTCLLTLVATTVFAANFQSASNIVIAEALEDDLYLAGSNIVINSPVSGDVFAAGNTVTINARIDGDLFVVGSQVMINADIRDDARVAGGTVNLNANIGGDLLAGSGTLDVSKGHSIGRDLVMAGGDLKLDSDIGRDIKGAGVNIVINGQIGRDIDLIVDKNLTIVSGSSVAGHLSYYAIQPASFDGVNIAGDVIYNDFQGSAGFLDSIKSHFSPVRLAITGISFLAILLIALIMLFVSPVHLHKTADEMDKSFFKSLIVGFLSAISLIVISTILLVAIAGVRMAVIATPLALIIYAFTFGFLYVSRIFFAVWLGRKILKSKLKKTKLKTKPYTFLMIILGLLLYYLSGMIPFWIGLIITLMFTFTGFGAFILSRLEIFKFMKKNGWA